MKDHETGIGHMVLKRSDIQRYVFMDDAQPNVKQLTLPCTLSDTGPSNWRA